MDGERGAKERQRERTVCVKALEYGVLDGKDEAALAELSDEFADVGGPQVDRREPGRIEITRRPGGVTGIDVEHRVAQTIEAFAEAREALQGLGIASFPAAGRSGGSRQGQGKRAGGGHAGQHLAPPDTRTVTHSQ